MQLEVKTILNSVQHFVGFVYKEVRLLRQGNKPEGIEIWLEAHIQMEGKCSKCRRSAPSYDRLGERNWLFVPLWAIKTYLLYSPRRVECPEHGVLADFCGFGPGAHCGAGLGR